MKTSFILFVVITLVPISLHAQKTFTVTTKTVERDININFINRDSVNLPLNANFELIEDSCSQITRYGHLKLEAKKFTGRFKDVSRAKPQLIITEGTYTDEGLKHGTFISRYLNGNLRSKGNFKNNQFDGKWEFYYEDGKPKFNLEANGDDIKITDSWDTNGIKNVENGNGTCRIDLEEMYWKGQLVNGKPNGQWKAIKTDNNSTLITETYNNGILKGGKTNSADATRLQLIAYTQLPYIKTEQLPISLVLCDGSDISQSKK